MIVVGLGLLVVGLGTLFAMVIHLMPANLWLSLAAYVATFTGLFMATLKLAARRRH